MKDKFLAIENPSTKARSYRLADAFESLVAMQVLQPTTGKVAKAKRK